MHCHVFTVEHQYQLKCPRFVIQGPVTVPVDVEEVVGKNLTRAPRKRKSTSKVCCFFLTVVLGNDGCNFQICKSILLLQYRMISISTISSACLFEFRTMSIKYF